MTRYKFLYRAGDFYHWESGHLPGDSRVDHVRCRVDWFWCTSAVGARRSDSPAGFDRLEVPL